MTPSVRLIALFALISLSMWLGYLLGKGRTQTPPTPTTVVAAPAVTVPSDKPEPAKTASRPDDAYSRVASINRRIEYLGAQTDDRVIAQERGRLLDDLALELNGTDSALFSNSIRYYNEQMPRDGAGLMLESHYHRRNKRWQVAMEPLLAAAEFPESNEQLEQIHAEQAQVVEQIYSEFADRDDWLALSEYFEELLLRDPNYDRIRLRLASVHAQSGDLDRALETLDGTGTEGVSRQEIDELREELVRTHSEPVRFRDEGGALVARASLNASDIELLVDTGATKTALATSTLQRLGAYPLNDSAQVQTASGRITAQLYRVPELIVENTRFSDLTVLALDNPPARWDGLLGMDLLREMHVDLSAQLDGEP